MKARAFSLLLAAAVLLLAAFPAAAAGPADDAGFSVQAVLPANQRDPDAAYFDLLVRPGQEQDLTIAIHNLGEADFEALVEVAYASTNRSGIINYSQDNPLDASIPFSFLDVAQVPQDAVTVAGGCTEWITVSLTLPDEEFDGMCMGAVRITKIPGEEKAEEGTGIVNLYSYVIGVRLTQTEDAPIPAPKFELDDVRAELVNYKAAIVASIQNSQPAVYKDVTASAQVYYQATGELVIERQQQSIELAPHAVFPLTLIDQAGYGFPPGAYRAAIHLEWEDMQWDYEQMFEIAEAQANYLNTNAVNQNQVERKQTSVAMPVAIGVCSLLALCLIAKRYAGSR